MQNQLLSSILNNIVMEKAVRDKIVMQQKQQKEQQARKRKEADYDEVDEFDDEETKEIMRKMRSQRSEAMQELQPHKRDQKRDVGEYREITETQFLDHVTKLHFTVVHFYHDDFERCKIMEKHLKILSQQFPNTQFLSLNAQKSPFFVQKLAVRTLPTLCIFINGVMKDKILGFQGLSGDDFLTYELAARLAESGVIERHNKKIKDSTILKGQQVSNDSDGDVEV